MSENSMGEDDFLEDGAPPPGKWEHGTLGSQSRTWKGRASWSTRHGVVVCHWLLGKPHQAKNVLMPDGSRNDAENVDTLTGLGWRRTDGIGWTFGDVTLSPDDAVFTDAAMQPGRHRVVRGHPEGNPDLADDIAADPLFLVAVADRDFASALYSAMCNVTWRKNGSTSRWSVSWRGAGGILADLRGLGEIYGDFYLDGNEGFIRDDVRMSLVALGWHEMITEEMAADHDAAVAEIGRLETLSEGDQSWYAARFGEFSKRDWPVTGRPSVSRRIHALGRSGRIDEAGFLRLCEISDPSRDHEVAASV